MTKLNSNYDATDLGWRLQTDLELFGHRNTDGIGLEVHIQMCSNITRMGARRP